MDFGDVLDSVLNVFTCFTGLAAVACWLLAAGFGLYWCATGVDVLNHFSRAFFAGLILAGLSVGALHLSDFI